jgi:hypothetical protein
MDWKTSFSTYFVWPISSVRTIGLPAPFLWVTESVSRNTPTQFVRHADKSFGILQSVGKNKNKTVWHIVTFKKWLTQMLRQLGIWKSMTTFDQDNFWYPGSLFNILLAFYMPKKAQFTHERVEYKVFLFDEHLRSLKLTWRFVLTSCDIYQNPFTQEKILKFWQCRLSNKMISFSY